MTRLLHAPVVDGPARRLDAPAPVLDQATRQLLARAEADAYGRGRADGDREAREAADRAGQQAVAAVTTAVEQVRRAVTAAGTARADAVVELGRRLAEAILDRELQAGGAALVDRVHAAAAALDHGPFTVHVSAVDEAVLDGHADGLPAGTTVVVDPRLRPGEARITGPWSGADLTLTAMLDALTEEATP